MQVTDGAQEFAEGCPRRCPGCAHRHLPLEESVAEKHRWLRERLEPWADRLAPVRAEAAEASWGYRDRACLAADWSEAEGWRFGLIRADELVAIPDCPVHSPRITATYRLLARSLPPRPVFPLAYWVQSGAQATLVLKGRELPDTAWLNDEVRAALAGIGMEGLWLHLFPSVGRKIFAKNGWHLVWGSPRSQDRTGGVYGPTAFQQLLPRLYQETLDQAERFLEPGSADAVVDLYCGSGATLRRWARRGSAVLGVELGGEAVESTRTNAPGVEVLRGMAATRIPRCALGPGSRRAGVVGDSCMSIRREPGWSPR